MRIVSLFSGAGGLDLGFARAGHEIVWANDNWRDAVETYRMNLGPHILLGDIRDIDATSIPDADVVIGGFPCQGFSVANTRRSVDDSRNLLYREFVRVVDAKRPAYLVAENVKGILTLGRGAVFQKITEDFGWLGYTLAPTLLNAADFGVPQRRERVFLLGVKGGSPVPLWWPPRRTHAPREAAAGLGLLPWVGVGEALAAIPEPDDQHDLQNHEATRYKLRFNGYLGHRVVDPALPSPTLTARGDDRGGVVIHHHPGNHRRLTAREAALVQSFPVDYRFFGPKTSVYRQVANAVPPRLAQAVAEAALGLGSRIGRVA
jgi:DNA (cytosine-5)-methyltransferase 1